MFHFSLRYHSIIEIFTQPKYVYKLLKAIIISNLRAIYVAVAKVLKFLKTTVKFNLIFFYLLHNYVCYQITIEIKIINHSNYPILIKICRID